MANPFESITFDQQEQQPVATVSNDDITRALISLNPKPMADAGIERVNQNTGNTGTVAYKDDKGQAVLTNVARDSSGQEKKIAALLRSPANIDETPTFTQGTTDRIALFEGVKRLTAATDINEARAIYASLQESIAAETTRLEEEAYKFAERKFGVTEIQTQLQLARQEDRADPMYTPGMGDSPITAKIVDDLRLLSASAKEDATGFLRRNLTFNSLKGLAATADREFKRVEALADRKEQRTLAGEITADNMQQQALLQQRLRREDRVFQQEQEALQTFNRLSATQIARISMLNAGALANITNEKEKQIKIADLALGNKDKKFQEAVSAESPRQLLGMALQGNGTARQLIIMEESMRTGRSVQEVESMISSMSTRLADKRMPSEVLNRNTKMKPSDRQARLSELNAAQFSLDPNKTTKVDETKLALLFEDKQFEIQQQFLGDVSSWNTSDPTLLAAIDKSKKVSGKADIRNVIAAFLGDATDVERKFRLGEFRKAMQNAALKQKESVFGIPNWREADAIIVNEIVNAGWFSNALRSVMQTTQTVKDNVPRSAMLPFPLNAAAGPLDLMFPKAQKED
jgi:hypothetical protein